MSNELHRHGPKYDAATVAAVRTARQLARDIGLIETLDMSGCGDWGVCFNEVLEAHKRGGAAAAERALKTFIATELVEPYAACVDQQAPAPSKAPQSHIWIDALREMGYTFRFNECGQSVEVNGKPLDDITISIINTKMRDLGFNNVNAIMDAYKSEAFNNKYHPVRDYLTSCEWDGADHIGALWAKFTTDGATVKYGDGDEHRLFDVYLVRWLVGAVAKAFDGHQNMMLVLDGPQGIGKSYLAKWLASGIPSYFHASKINPDDKDDFIRLMSMFIWEVEELDYTTAKADVAALKGFITRSEVAVRKAYGRADTRGPALASMIGTVNNNGGFLRDDTGSRRFMVATVTGIDHSYATEIDVNQVWAQAVDLYRGGMTWMLLPEEAAAQREQNGIYEIDDPLVGSIAKHFECNGDAAVRMSMTDIIEHLERKGVSIGAGSGRQKAGIVAPALKKLGVVKKMIGGYSLWAGIAPVE